MEPIVQVCMQPHTLATTVLHYRFHYSGEDVRSRGETKSKSSELVCSPHKMEAEIPPGLAVEQNVEVSVLQVH
ncbi:MAG: hypothetical protein JAY75_22820 [Candidatus Thiodiazotropha taylori]|nr:hypothetical protein [Candidatus Thiodiazotropha taylori]MCG8096957.1 hypothetical protein [Candidatus Thiodiazotropha endolucinida]MCG8033110.1 hypothetical protein [Candidatus Thiodiazotropha taylori]MCG8045423.1 hypothetical protein [Candidatus Thiodiazotropha taylori]MCG8079054.1 hypothetical protein [Candidatus Thiodiazotropha taylori]